VLKDGKLVYERYFTQNPVSIHRLYSVTKSFAGLMAATLIHEGKMKRSDPITHYVPELKGTAYDQATISNLLEQTVGAQFREFIPKGKMGKNCII
jgi:beta-lactamase